MGDKVKKVHCCICGRLQIGKNGVKSVHCVPPTGVRKCRWLTAIKLGNHSCSELSLCNRHFQATDFKQFARRSKRPLERALLKREAIPSLFLTKGPPFLDNPTDQNVIRNGTDVINIQPINFSGNQPPPIIIISVLPSSTLNASNFNDTSSRKQITDDEAKNKKLKPIMDLNAKPPPLIQIRQPVTSKIPPKASNFNNTTQRSKITYDEAKKPKNIILKPIMDPNAKPPPLVQIRQPVTQKPPNASNFNNTSQRSKITDDEAKTTKNKTDSIAKFKPIMDLNTKPPPLVQIRQPVTQNPPKASNSDNTSPRCEKSNDEAEKPENKKLQPIMDPNAAPVTQKPPNASNVNNTSQGSKITDDETEIPKTKPIMDPNTEPPPLVQISQPVTQKPPNASNFNNTSPRCEKSNDEAEIPKNHKTKPIIDQNTEPPPLVQISSRTPEFKKLHFPDKDTKTSFHSFVSDDSDDDQALISEHLKVKTCDINKGPPPLLKISNQDTQTPDKRTIPEKAKQDSAILYVCSSTPPSTMDLAGLEEAYLSSNVSALDSYKSKIFSHEEIDYLVELLLGEPVIHTRKLSGAVIIAKNEAWQRVTEAFNKANISDERTVNNLKAKFHKLKVRLRAKLERNRLALPDCQEPLLSYEVNALSVVNGTDWIMPDDEAKKAAMAIRDHTYDVTEKKSKKKLTSIDFTNKKRPACTSPPSPKKSCFKIASHTVKKLQHEIFKLDSLIKTNRDEFEKNRMQYLTNVHNKKIQSLQQDLQILQARLNAKKSVSERERQLYREEHEMKMKLMKVDLELNEAKLKKLQNTSY